MWLPIFISDWIWLPTSRNDPGVSWSLGLSQDAERQIQLLIQFGILQGYHGSPVLYIYISNVRKGKMASLAPHTLFQFRNFIGFDLSTLYKRPIICLHQPIDTQKLPQQKKILRSIHAFMIRNELTGLFKKNTVHQRNRLLAILFSTLITNSWTSL